MLIEDACALVWRLAGPPTSDGQTRAGRALDSALLLNVFYFWIQYDFPERGLCPDMNRHLSPSNSPRICHGARSISVPLPRQSSILTGFTYQSSTINSLRHLCDGF